MIGGRACQCAEKYESIAATGNRPGRLWRVRQYRCNHSAFNGYHETSSDYSSIECLRCGRIWRTKAPYADLLAPIADEERNISAGYERHAEAMVERGREPYRSHI